MRNLILCLIVFQTISSVAAQSEEIDKNMKESFSRLVEKYNKEKGLEPYKRLETIKQFASYKLPECDKFLVSILAKEKNLSIIREITIGLITLGSPVTISAAVKIGLPRLIPLIQISVEPDPMIPKKWIYKTKKNYRMLPMFYFGAIAGTFTSVNNEEGCKWLLEHGLESPISRDPLLSKFIISIIAEISHPDRDKTLLYQLKKQRDPQIIATILDSIRVAGIKDPSLSKTVVRFFRSRSEDVQLAAVMCLEEVAPDILKSEVPGLLKNRSKTVRLLAVDAVSKCKIDIEILFPLIKDKSWEVRVSVVRALGMSLSKRAVTVLVKSLNREENPRVVNDIVDTLIRIIGKDLGDQYPAWDSWWRANKLKVDLKWRDSAELGKIKGEKAAAGRTAYFGLNVSNFSSFLLDVSRSMNEEYAIDIIKSGKSSGRTSVKEKEKRITVKKEKIEFAKDNLKKVLKKLSSRLKFNIITFCNDATPWQEKLVNNSYGMRNKAFAFLDNLTPSGSTDIFDSLVLALRDKQVDTIYLLSDGAPTSGLIVDKSKILQEIKRINFLKKVRINTIGFNLEDDAKELMKNLADDNFGAFIMK